MTVEITGLSLFTHHGVTEAERDTGQRLLFDVSLDLDDCDATVTDRLEDTIDYGAVCDTVALVATERSYRTLERLCTAVADALTSAIAPAASWSARRSRSRRCRSPSRKSRSRSLAEISA